MSEQYTPTTDNRTNEELASRLRQFAESQAMDFDSPYTATMLNEVADRLVADQGAEVAAKAWQEGHGDPECDKWIVSGMCAEYHPNPYRKAVQDG